MDVGVAQSQEDADVEATTPPPLPPRAAPVVSDGCDCGAVNPVSLESAWEQMEVLKANRGNVGSSTAVVQPEELHLRIYAGTWNVAGLLLEEADSIGEWLDVDFLNHAGDKGEPPDIFVVGFQEVVNLSAQNVVIDSFLDTQSRANSLKWFTLVYAFLNQYGQRHGVKYVMLSEQRLLGTYVLVMATEALCPKIRHVQSAVIPTGLGGWLGNKGAVAVRMEVGGSSSLCFVCVHMAAHRENVEARNADYKVISSRPIFTDTSGRLAADPTEDAASNDSRQGAWGAFFGGGAQQSGNGSGLSPSRSSEVKKAIKAAMSFGLPKGSSSGGRSTGVTSRGDEGTSASPNGAGKGSNGASPAQDATQQDPDDFLWMPSEEGMANGMPKTLTILQADLVFWLGDLNYRIKEGTPDALVLEMIEKDDLENLRRMDQLNIERAAGTVFQEFQEGPLCFAPTYKYIPGTRDLDTRPEKKVRCPSWCDRVLYSLGTSGSDSVRRLALDRYWSSGPLLSDHMPVSALFRTSLLYTPEETTEREIGVEVDSPTGLDAAPALESSPFPHIALNPPALTLSLNGDPFPRAVAEITNTGGVRGKYHVCKDSLPSWLSLEAAGDAELGPGEKGVLGLVVDAAAADVAALEEGNGGGQIQNRPAACAVLRVEVDGGGSGSLLPVVCILADTTLP